MKKTIITLLLILIIIPLVKSQDFKEYYFKFDIKDRSEIETISKVVSIDKVIGNTVFAYSTSLKFDKFLKLGYTYTLIEEEKPTKATMANTVAEMVNWDKYPTHDVYVQMMSDYATNYPEICQLINIGTTVRGRNLYVLKISNNVSVEENEPEFFYTSTMHGDETTGFVLMLRLIDSLVTNYGTITEITNLVNDIELYINPNANPDGTYGADGATISSPTRYNANGVDINRNFPDPSGDNHPDGESWQPETQAMMAFANEHKFVVSGNFHGGIELANYPWDVTSRRHPDDAWFIKVSRDYATSCQNNSPAGYFDAENNGITNGYDWYYAAGTRQDYYTYYHNSREVTFEISNTKNVAASALPAYWNYNKEALFQFMRESLYGIKGTVVDIEGNPINSMITIQGHDTSIDSSMVFTDPDVGDYHRPIEEGTFDIIASAYGYISDTIKSVTTTYDNTQTANFILQKDITYNISGEIIDSITGNSLENAIVQLKNIPVENSYTDNNGEYSINNVIEGTYEIVIFLESYSRLTEQITVNSVDTIFNFKLLPVELENFETGDFSEYNWQFSGNVNWIIDNANYYEGTNSARSGDIGHSNTSTLSLDVNLKDNGFISFYKKVSSEKNYDFLQFFVDDAKIEEWSGESDWSLYEHEIESGEHTLKWTYKKDGNTSEGSDCAWIDYVSIPRFQIPVLILNPDTIQDTLNIDNNKTIFLEIENISEETFNYIASLNQTDWISINKTLGTIEPQSKDTIEVFLDASDTLAGAYNCEISISKADYTEIYTCPVNLIIKNPQSVLKIQLKDLKIYPNPFNDYIVIDFFATKSVHHNISIYDICGSKIYENTYKPVANQFNKTIINSNKIRNLKNGMYFIQIKTDNFSITKQIIKN